MAKIIKMIDLIKEAKLTEGRPRGYAEEIAQDLVKKKKVRKGMNQNKLIDAIFKWLKRYDRNKNRVRWLMSYDEDFLSDTISAINNYLKEGKLSEEKVNTYKVNRAFDGVISHMRKSVKKLNDDEWYELTVKLKKWFNKNVM